MEISNNVSSVNYTSTQGGGTTSASAPSEVTKVETEAPVAKQIISEETVAKKESESEVSGSASNASLKKAVETINKNLGSSEAIFGIHEATNRLTVKIVDKETKDVIKEYPAEKTLDMIAKMWELAGIMVDEKR